MIEKSFYDRIGNRCDFRVGDVSYQAGCLLPESSLVGTVDPGRSGGGRLVRLSLVEKPARRILRGRV